jgi:hypothetical protein
MSPLFKRIAKRLVLIALCCIAPGVISFAPASKVGGPINAAAATLCYYNWEYYYYSDASHSQVVGYKSCHGAWGYATPYYDREMIVCGGPNCQEP